MKVWLLMLALAAPPDAQADFTAANERALQGDLRAAIALYESLLERGIDNVDVLFNLGNAHAKNEDYIAAVVAYERALRLDPGDSDVAANLAAVRLRLDPNTNARLATPDAPLTAADALAPWAAALPMHLAALLLLIGNAVFWSAWWWPQRRTQLLAGGAILGGIGAIFVIAQALVASDPVAIVMRAGHLREGPRPQFRQTGPIAAGTRVRIIDDNGAWREVQRDDGTTGWMPLKDLARL